MCIGNHHLWWLGCSLGMAGLNMNESAFPTGIITDNKGVVIGGSNGMSLRDYFAAKAMNGIMMYSVEWNSTGKPADQISLNIFKDMAQDSYAIADAMLKAREQ